MGQPNLKIKIFTLGKKKTWNGSEKKAGVQNGEKCFDKSKTQLIQHEYSVFHLLNLCPPDDIKVDALHDYQHLPIQIEEFLHSQEETNSQP